MRWKRRWKKRDSKESTTSRRICRRRHKRNRRGPKWQCRQLEEKADGRTQEWKKTV